MASCKKLRPGQLKTLLSNGFYLKLSKFNNSSDYKLDLAGRQRGGGIAAGSFSATITGMGLVADLTAKAFAVPGF